MIEPSQHPVSDPGREEKHPPGLLRGLRELEAADIPLLLVTIAVPVLPTQAKGFALRIMAVVILALAALMLLPASRGGYRWRLRSPGNPLDWYFILWLIIGGLGILAAPNLGFCAYKIGYTLSLAILFYCFTTRIRSFSKGLLFVCTAGLSALFVSLIEIAFSELPKQSLLFIHSYLAAQFLLPVLLMLSALAINPGPRLLRTAAAITALPVLVLLFLIGSRATFFALIAGGGLILVLSLLRFNTKRGRRGFSSGIWFALIIIGVTVSAVMALSATGLLGAPGLLAFERVTSLFNPDLIDFNFSRLQIWKDALKMSQDHLLIGVGPGNFPMVFPAYQEVAREGILHPHNQFIQVLCEYGGLGLFCFLAVVIHLIRLARRSIRIDDGDDLRFALCSGAAGALAVAGIYCLFETPLEWPASAIFLLLPLSLLLLTSEKELQRNCEARPWRPWIAVAAVTLLMSVWPVMHLYRAVQSGIQGNVGHRLYLEGRFNEAVEQLEESAASWPYRSEIYSLLALAAHRNGQPVKALEAAKKALELRPGKVDMLALYGRGLYNTGKYREAIGCFKEAIFRSPTGAATNYFWMGKACREAGFSEAALLVFRDLYNTRFYQKDKGALGFQSLLEMVHCLLTVKREPEKMVTLLQKAFGVTRGEPRNLEKLQKLLENMEDHPDLAPSLRRWVNHLMKRVDQALSESEEL